jgi:hypothetical protein
VADLLECLIQIKGVADTPRRLAPRVEAAVAGGREREAADVAARLAIADARFANCLAVMLTDDRPLLPSLDLASMDIDPRRALAAWMADFTRRRAEIVASLDKCSADDLNRLGLEPARGPMSVADLVALVLAHDTDQLGRLVVP